VADGDFDGSAEGARFHVGVERVFGCALLFEQARQGVAKSGAASPASTNDGLDISKRAR